MAGDVEDIAVKIVLTDENNKCIRCHRHIVIDNDKCKGCKRKVLRCRCGKTRLTPEEEEKYFDMLREKGIVTEVDSEGPEVWAKAEELTYAKTYQHVK